MSAFIGYPTGRLLAVIDDPAVAAAAIDELVAAGVAPDDVQLLTGPDGASRLDGTGAVHGIRARILRLVQFVMMDQLPDFASYEAAAREGRAVVVVRVPDAARRRAAVGTLERAGGHFMNYFGRLATEEISRWRGPEPNVPAVLRR
ncbi:MAG TPA: hypothetical protein VFR14_06805 [Candidatus Limnocylindrales bacterium]|nr:hypothetical protein [Candidatus Limnocylindrales bacterium]